MLNVQPQETWVRLRVRRISIGQTNTHPPSSNGPKESQPASKRRLVPAASFANVMEDLAKISGWLLLHHHYLY